MVFHRHAIHRGRARRPDLKRPQQRRRDQLQLHHSKVLAKTGTRAGREWHEHCLDVAGMSVCLEPPFREEGVGVTKDAGVALRRVALRGDDGL
jgi:hypothetical protein